MIKNQKKKTIVSCPQCGKDVEWSQNNPYRPFCSERCKLIDLGQWANEGYRIPDKDTVPDQDSNGSGHA